jgi:hypothetical protein
MCYIGKLQSLYQTLISGRRRGIVHTWPRYSLELDDNSRDDALQIAGLHWAHNTRYNCTDGRFPFPNRIVSVLAYCRGKQVLHPAVVLLPAPKD